MVVKPNKNDNSSFKSQKPLNKKASANNRTGNQLQNQILNILVTENKITQNNANDIILKADKEGNNVIQALRESNIVQPDDLARALAEFYKLPFVILHDLHLNPEIINRLPQDISKNYLLIVFDIIGDKLFKIATSRPEDPKVVQVIDFLKTKNNIDTELYVASETDLQDALKLFDTQKIKPLGELVKNPISGAKDEETEGKITTSSLGSNINSDEQKAESTPESRADVSAIDFQNLIQEDVKNIDSLKKVVASGLAPNIITALVKYAINLKASDIHIEPEEKVLRIRFRIDGVLRNVIDLNINLHPAIIARIKISAHLKIDEQRIPQDGRFDASYGNKKIDIRVSTLPTSHGEKVVMRLLDKTQGVITIEELGLTGRGYNSLLKNIKKPYGMILATGPTGSGKTTTLYAILQSINNPQINIVTLEDPIEYQLEGVNHCQVRPDIGFDFANGLRSIVRQDPNVIMVGEIRDKETAEMAIHAALTGHLLLSTLHTNNAAGAIPRLIDMGIEPFLISSTLNVIIAQRLVRKICEKCRVKAEIPQELLLKIEKEVNALPTDIRQKFPQKPVFYTGKGCQYCTNGYSGRIGLFEVLEVNESIGELTAKRAATEEINAMAIKNGMITIRQDGLVKAMSGITSLDEVLRISLSALTGQTVTYTGTQIRGGALGIFSSNGLNGFNLTLNSPLYVNDQLTFTLKFKPTQVGDHQPVDIDPTMDTVNYAKIRYHKYGGNEIVSPIAQAYIDVIGGLQVIGDVHAGNGITITGSSTGVVTSGGTIADFFISTINRKIANYTLRPGSSTSWSTSLDAAGKRISSIEKIAKNLPTDRKLNPYGLPEGGVYSTDALTLSDTTFQGKGTIIVNGNLNITGNITSDSPVGFIVKNGNVNIFGNAGLIKASFFVPDGSINISSNPIQFELDGFLVGQSINFNLGTSVGRAVINYDNGFAASPPAGFDYIKWPSINEATP